MLAAFVGRTKPVRPVLVMYLGWFVIINFFAIVAHNRFNLSPDTAYPWIDPEATAPTFGWNPIPLHNKWDSYFFLDIARNGYSASYSDGLSNLVFFPLFPALVALVGVLCWGNLPLAGWIVSTVAGLVAAIYLYLLVKDFHPKASPGKAVFFMLIFPTAFFLNGVYSEATFVALSIASFYHARKDQPLRAGLFGLLAALTRFSGIFLILPLVYELWWRHRHDEIPQPTNASEDTEDTRPAVGTSSDRPTIFRSLTLRRIVGALLPVLGTLAFFIYHQVAFGSFFRYFEIQKAWGRGFILNLEHLQLTTPPAKANFLLDVSITLFLLVATIIVAQRIRDSYALYMALSLLPIITSGTLMSVSRFALVLFPVFILLAHLKNEILYQLTALTSILFLALYTLAFVSHYWAG